MDDNSSATGKLAPRANPADLQELTTLFDEHGQRLIQMVCLRMDRRV
jgi:hypothetical protein